MIHLKGKDDEDVFERAKKEIAIYIEHGVDGIILETYFGNYYQLERILEYVEKSNLPDLGRLMLYLPPTSVATPLFVPDTFTPAPGNAPIVSLTIPRTSTWSCADAVRMQSTKKEKKKDLIKKGFRFSLNK